MRLAASIPRGLPHGPFWPGLAATQWGLSVSRDWEDGSGDFKPLWSTRTAKEEKPTNSKTRTQESLPGRNLQYPLGLKGFGSKKSPAKTEVEGFAAWLACIMHRSLFAFLPVLGLLTVTFGGCKEVPRYPWPMAAAGLIRNRCHWQKFFFFFFGGNIPDHLWSERERTYTKQTRQIANDESSNGLAVHWSTRCLGSLSSQRKVLSRNLWSRKRRNHDRGKSKENDAMIRGTNEKTAEKQISRRPLLHSNMDEWHSEVLSLNLALTSREKTQQGSRSQPRCDWEQGQFYERSQPPWHGLHNLRRL